MENLKNSKLIILFFFVLGSCANKSVNIDTKEKEAVIRIKDFVLKKWESTSSSQDDIPYIIINQKKINEITNGFIDSQKKLVISQELINDLNFLFLNNLVVDFWYYNKRKFCFVLSKDVSITKTSIYSICFLNQNLIKECKKYQGLDDFYICITNESS
jgi:hypothetical protein